MDYRIVLNERQLAFYYEATRTRGGGQIPLTLPYINNFLISEIAKEMERQRKVTKIRADRGYRYLVGYDR